MLLRIAAVAVLCFGLAVAQEECGGTFSLASDGSALTITSPGFPNSYAHNLNCLYTVSTEAGDNFKAIEVNSNTYDLENTYDYLEFFEADGSAAGKFSGSSGPSKLRLSSTTITFRFRTDSSVARTGFSIRFSLAKCNKGEGSCPNHPDVCLAGNAWCNGVNDCPDAADEDCPDPGSCGKSAVKPHGSRIVGGNEVNPHSHPWQAAMLSSGGSQICGGTIVAPQWIMTAAHCCAAYSPSPSNYKFRIGAHAHASNEDGASTVTLEKIVMHPSYNSPVRYAHDFCLVKTSERMQYTRQVQPACIPSEAVAEGEEVVVTGWGNTMANRGDFDDFIRLVKDVEEGRIPKGVGENMIKASSVLREVKVNVVNQEQCNRAYSGGISADMICGAAPGKDSCQGDSGGPLVHVKDGVSFLHGVVSWGRGCAQPNYPGVYGRMSEVTEWIMSTIAQG